MAHERIRRQQVSHTVQAGIIHHWTNAAQAVIGEKLLKPAVAERGHLDGNPIFEEGLLGVNGAAETQSQ